MSSRGNDTPSLLESLTAQVSRAQRYYGESVNAQATFAARLEAEKFLQQHLEEIVGVALSRGAERRPRRNHAERLAVAGTYTSELDDLPIFRYWDDPKTQPPVVVACGAQLEHVLRILSS